MPNSSHGQRLQSEVWGAGCAREMNNGGESVGLNIMTTLFTPAPPMTGTWPAWPCHWRGSAPECRMLASSRSCMRISGSVGSGGCGLRGIPAEGVGLGPADCPPHPFEAATLSLAPIKLHTHLAPHAARQLKGLCSDLKLVIKLVGAAASRLTRILNPLPGETCLCPHDPTQSMFSTHLPCWQDDPIPL
jgi:hypothetical protein